MKRSTRVKALLPNNFALLMAASREASLAGRTTVTPDDLLVALLVTGGPAAHVLATHSADLVALRQAVVDRDAADLASLGIDGDHLTPQRRTLADTFARQRAIDITPAVEEMLTALPSERELLHILLTDPSGAPAEALTRAGVDVDAVLAHAPWPVAERSGRAEPVPGLLDGQKEATTVIVRFVPVAFERVVEVVTDPAAVASWYLPSDDVELGDDGASLVLRQEHRGRRLVHECRRVRSDVTDVRADVIWQNFWVEPAAADPRGFYIRIQAERAGSGTQVRITRGANGRGRFAPLARLLFSLVSKGTGKNLVHGLVEVAVTPA